VDLISKAINKTTCFEYFSKSSLESRCLDLYVFSISNYNINVTAELECYLPEYLKFLSKESIQDNSELHHRNVRYTVRHIPSQVEMYISIYPVLMRNVEHILLSECEDLLRTEEQLISFCPAGLYDDLHSLLESVKAVNYNLTSVLEKQNEVKNSLCSYTTQRNFLRRLGYTSSFHFWKQNIFVKSLVKMYGIIRAYNANYIHIQARLRNTMYSINVQASKERLILDALMNGTKETPIDSLLLEGINGFKMNKNNWITNAPDGSLKIKRETELTKQLETYLQRKNVKTAREVSRGTGKSDLEIDMHIIDFDYQKATVEIKLSNTDSDADVIDKYTSALHQIKHYTKDNNNAPYIILFFSQLDLDKLEKLLLKCDRLLKRAESSRENGFKLIHDQKIKVLLVELPLQAPSQSYRRDPLTDEIKRLLKNPDF
jgi:hypothetical protein